MAIKVKTLKDDESFLRQVSSEVNLEKDNYQECIEELKKYCQNNAVFAMAPVQIGIPKRMIYIRNTSSDMSKNFTDHDEGLVLINPKIIEAYGHTIFLEGCESCSVRTDNDAKIYLAGEVDRPYKIKMEYYDIQKNKNTKYFEGFECTVICHEYDHLNGILHIDKSDNIYEMSLEEERKYRLEHPYKIISKTNDYML